MELESTGCFKTVMITSIRTFTCSTLCAHCAAKVSVKIHVTEVWKMTQEGWFTSEQSCMNNCHSISIKYNLHLQVTITSEWFNLQRMIIDKQATEVAGMKNRREKISCRRANNSPVCSLKSSSTKDKTGFFHLLVFE